MEAVKFRRGGKIPVRFRHCFSSNFPSVYEQISQFLRLLIFFNSNNLISYITERCKKALTASCAITILSRLFAMTALRLFDLRATSVAAYGATLISGYLELLNLVKTFFLTRALGLYRTAENSLVKLFLVTPRCSSRI